MKWPRWILFLLTLFENCLALVVLPISVYHLSVCIIKAIYIEKGLYSLLLFFEKKNLYMKTVMLCFTIYIYSFCL